MSGFRKCLGFVVMVAALLASTASAANAAPSITGTVTGPAGALLEGICVSADDLEFDDFGYDETDVNGQYSIDDLPTDTYTVQFSDCNDTVGNFQPEFFNNQRTYDTATPVSVTAGTATPNIHAQLEAGGSISGTVTASGGGALNNICVDAEDTNFDFNDYAETNGSGQYTIDDLPTASYKVTFSDCNDSGNFVTEFYDNKTTFAAANPVSVTAGLNTPTIDAALDAGGAITGTVTGPSGSPLPSICVQATSGADLDDSETDLTNGSGQYTLDDLPAGSYRVLFTDCISPTPLAFEWYTNKASFATANTVLVTAGVTTLNIGAQLDPAGTITGTVTRNGANASGICVSALDPGNEAIHYAEATTSSTGTYTLPGLQTGTYKVFFDDCGPGGTDAKYYNQQSTYATANVVIVTAPSATSGINAAFGGAPAPTVTIISGPTGSTSERRPTFAFTASAGSTVQCSISTGAASYGPCSGASSHQPAADLADGSYTFSVRASSAGGEAVATRSFTLTTASTTPTTTTPTTTTPTTTTPTTTTPTTTDPTATDAACDAAEEKLAKAKKALKKAKKSGKASKIKKAKAKVKKAQAAVDKDC